MHSHSGVVSHRPLEDLASFQVLEVAFLDHGDDRVVDGPLVVEPHAHLALQLLEGDPRTDGDSALDRVLDLLAHFSELNRRFSLLAREAALRGIQSRNLEQPVRFLDVSGGDCRLQVDFGDGLGDANDCLELAYRDRDARRLLVKSLVLRGRPILDVEVLQHVTGFLSQLRLDLEPRVADILAQVFERDLALDLLVGLIAVHVQPDDVPCDGLIGVYLADVAHDENRVEAGQD